MTAVDFAAFVERLAQVSGEVILPFFRSAIGAEDKSLGGVFDPVTEADRGAEAAMRRLIGQTFPAHGVIGEEYGVDRADAEYVWVLDPIDGTKSFISGMPTWGTLIGLMHRGRPVYGMMAQPFTRERFTGDGKRARLRTLAPSRGDAPPTEWTTRTLRDPRLRLPRRGDDFDDEPGADPGRGRPRGLPTRRSEDAALALRRGLLRLLRARRGLRRPRHRDRPEAARRRGARADHRGGGRRHHDLGGRGRLEGRAHPRRGRPARLRRGAEPAEGVSLTGRRTGRTAPASARDRDAARRGRRAIRRRRPPRRLRAHRRAGRSLDGGAPREQEPGDRRRCQRRGRRREGPGAPDRRERRDRRRHRERERHRADQGGRGIDRPALSAAAQPRTIAACANAHAREPHAGERRERPGRPGEGDARRRARRQGPRGRQAPTPRRGWPRRSSDPASGLAPAKPPFDQENRRSGKSQRRKPGEQEDSADAGFHRRGRVAAAGSRRRRADQAGRADRRGDRKSASASGDVSEARSKSAARRDRHGRRGRFGRQSPADEGDEGDARAGGGRAPDEAREASRRDGREQRRARRSSRPRGGWP